MRDVDHSHAGDQYDIGPDSGALDDAFAFHHVQIVRHLLRENALILNEVSIDEYGNDQGRKDQAGHESSRTVYVGTESHECKIHEGQKGTGRDNPGGGAPGPLLSGGVQPMNPSGVQIEKIEDEVTNVGGADDEYRIGQQQQHEI